MSRRGWVLFAAMSVIWGIPYLGLGERGMLTSTRLTGLAVGVLGVALVVGFGRGGSARGGT
jgi:hypothetical protein